MKIGVLKNTQEQKVILAVLTDNNETIDIEIRKDKARKLHKDLGEALAAFEN